MLHSAPLALCIIDLCEDRCGVYIQIGRYENLMEKHRTTKTPVARFLLEAFFAVNI